MGKIFRKIKDFCKRYIFKNKIVSIIIGVAVIGLLLFVILNRTNVDSIKRVKKILSNKYYKVECMSEECNYIIAYSGDKLGKTNILIYNAYGKKIASYTETFNSESNIVRNIFAITKNYIIFKKDNVVAGKTDSYIIATTKAKEKYISENQLSSLNDNLISEKLEESYNILDKNGKKLYTNVSNIKTLGDNKYLSVTIKKEDVILNEKGDVILNGYRIVKQVKDANDNVIYFVLQDSKRTAYYYYNIKNNKIVGDSFTGYTEGSNKGELLITKRVNNETKNYILKQNGDLEKLNKASKDELKNIDTTKYEIVYDSYIIPTQKAILVREISSNSFGTYNIKKNKFNKLFDYKENSAMSGISKLLSTENDLYLQISCSECEDKKLIVYDMVNDKNLYSIETKDYEIQYFTNYGDYNVVKYSSNSSEEYKDKYAVYDKKNKEVFKSDQQIVLADRKLVFGKEPSNYSLILYSTKAKKALNDSESLADKISIGDSYLYKFSANEKTYLYNSVGDKLKVINNANASFIYSTETIMYIENDKVFIINPTDSRTSTYRLRENEKINASDGESIPPYRNTLFINNTINNNIKIVNVNGRTIKSIKNSVIESVDYNKDTRNVIIVTKQVKDNNNYYGLYIGK
ncbi:MAG: hypothetical protein IKF37_00395 [Bacilli bacterium]|nr:hypothetical protein [Bacilli bacterium]